MPRQLRFPFPREEREDEHGAPSLDLRRDRAAIFDRPVGRRPPMFPVGGVSPPAASDAETRDTRRSRRKHAIRATTVSVKRMTKRELELGRVQYPPEEHADVERPKTRAECVGGQRPCPFVSCVHHLFLDVSARTGAIKLNFPDLDVDELPETCALDVADRGGLTLQSVADIMNLTRERIRQVEVRALAKLEATNELAELRAFYPTVSDGVGKGKRRLPVLRDIDPDEFAGESLDD
jgi:hypothetical protein